MGILEIFTEGLKTKKLTESSLREAIEYHNSTLADTEKRRINRRLAHEVITSAGGKSTKEAVGENTSLPTTKVLGVNHSSPLDVTIEWKTKPDGTLNIAGCRTDAGGDQVNVSKVFSNFNETIALVALTGKEEGELTRQWEKDFLTKSIIPTLIRNEKEDQAVEVINILDGKPLPVMHGWADELSLQEVEKINQESLKLLEEMFKGSSETIWMVLSAGGPLRHNHELAYYASLIKEVKKKYGDKVEFLIDFWHMSDPLEALSALNIERSVPQDIIKPNVEEFIQILTVSGLASKDTLDKNSITESDIKKYALTLREKYNLLGVLVSLDENGLMLVTEDRTIKEKGIKINLVCHTAAGDSLKAGFIYALSEGKSFEEAVHTANLFGASTASMEGTQTVTPEKLTEIKALALKQNIAPEVL